MSWDMRNDGDETNQYLNQFFSQVLYQRSYMYMYQMPAFIVWSDIIIFSSELSKEM